MAGPLAGDPRRMRAVTVRVVPAVGTKTAIRPVSCRFAQQLGLRRTVVNAAAEAIPGVIEARLPHAVPSIQLLRLVARGDAAKDLEILVSATSSPSCAARSHDSGWRPPTGRCSPRSAACSPGPAGRASSCSRRRWGLAPAAGRWRLDLPAPPDGPATAGPGDPTADRPPGQGEPHLGLPAHQGRTAAPRGSGLGDRDPNDASPPWAGPGTTASRRHLVGVPAPAGRRDRRLRPASPWRRRGCGGCRCCCSSNWTPAGSTSPA
jgi:hypothetical protein